MRDCVILINDRLVSLTHNSLLLIQPPTCPQSRSPTCVRVLVRVFGTVGTVEKVLGTDKTLTFSFWKIWPPPNLITDWINLSRFRRQSCLGSSGCFDQPHRPCHPRPQCCTCVSRQQSCLGAGVGTEHLPKCFSLTCLGPHQQMRKKQLTCRWVLSPAVPGGSFRTSITGTDMDTSWKIFCHH